MPWQRADAGLKDLHSIEVDVRRRWVKCDVGIFIAAGRPPFSENAW